MFWYFSWGFDSSSESECKGRFVPLAGESSLTGESFGKSSLTGELTPKLSWEGELGYDFSVDSETYCKVLQWNHSVNLQPFDL